MALTLLQRARILNGEIIRLRVQEALRIVATEVSTELLPSGSTAQEISAFGKRQSLATHYKAKPEHWAEVVIAGTFKEGDNAGLEAVIEDLDKEGLSTEAEAAVDAAILQAIRDSYGLYVAMVVGA